MSFENTQCPCGDKKPTDTMLCDVCMSDLAGRREMAMFQDASLPLGWRRQAAIVLLALARGRKRRAVVAAAAGA